MFLYQSFSCSRFHTNFFGHHSNKEEIINWCMLPKCNCIQADIFPHWRKKKNTRKDSNCNRNPNWSDQTKNYSNYNRVPPRILKIGSSDLHSSLLESSIPRQYNKNDIRHCLKLQSHNCWYNIHTFSVATAIEMSTESHKMTSPFSAFQ